MRYLLVTLIGLLALPGCAREADMVPLNDAANRSTALGMARLP